MEETTLTQLQEDIRVRNGDIPLVNKVETIDAVLSLVDTTKPGDYISVLNRNNLSEHFIYKRNKLMDGVVKWETGMSNISWYNEKEQEFHLQTPEEVAGIGVLVERGVTFENKYIYLENDIDISDFPWKPIGSKECQLADNKTQEVGEFKGTFDGLNHIICGLNNDPKYPQFEFSFFMKVSDAEIKNVSFLHTKIESSSVDMIASSVAINAVNSSFFNIFVDGMIVGSKVASICVYALNSVFYHCTNIAQIMSNSYSTPRICVGGICAELGISMSKVPIERAKIFSHCYNKNTITVLGSNISSLYAGQIFGNLLCEDKKFSAIIEKCSVPDNPEIVYKGKDSLMESVFYGTVEGKQARAHIEKDSKKDLLLGLIGRVKVDCDITVINITNSVMITNMVLPSTVNTMRSKSNSPTFYTLSAENIHTEDCLYDLEPYFTFIKSVRY